MSWVRFDDRFYNNRKVMSVSLAARWLYVSGLCVANQHSSNGLLDRVSQECLLVSVGRSGDFDALASELVRAGLWVDNGDQSFTIHDYLEYQLTADEQRKERAAAAERQKRFRAKRRASADGITPLQTPLSTPSKTVPRPVPSRYNTEVSLTPEGSFLPSDQQEAPGSTDCKGDAKPERQVGQVSLSLDDKVPSSDASSAPASGKPSREVANRMAIVLLGQLSEARLRVNPANEILAPRECNLREIRGRLLEGHTADEIRHVIAVCEARARVSKEAEKFFTAVSPFRASNLGMWLGMTVEQASRPDRQPAPPQGWKADPTTGRQRDPEEVAKENAAWLNQ